MLVPGVQGPDMFLEGFNQPHSPLGIIRHSPPVVPYSFRTASATEL